MRRNRKLSAKLLLCRVVPRTRVGKELREAVAGYEMALFRTVVHQRIAYVEALIAGLGVTRFAPASLAAEEIRHLVAEIQP
jgi:chromosome partitioning protein